MRRAWRHDAACCRSWTASSSIGRPSCQPSPPTSRARSRAGWFVGRTQELARLHQLLGRAVGGEPLVSPGIDKGVLAGFAGGSFWSRFGRMNVKEQGATVASTLASAHSTKPRARASAVPPLKIHLAAMTGSSRRSKT
jgi:hypothetical protein